MAKEILKYILWFAALVAAQVIVFNNLCLFNIAIPLVFIYFIIKLPVTLGVNWVMTLSFLLGLTVDIFSNTQGMNALACTILGAMRAALLRAVLPDRVVRVLQHRADARENRSLGATHVRHHPGG